MKRQSGEMEKDVVHILTVKMAREERTTPFKKVGGKLTVSVELKKS